MSTRTHKTSAASTKTDDFGGFVSDLAGFVKDCLRDVSGLVPGELRSSSGSCSKGITTILLPLLIPTNQKHQPVKTSLQKRSLRAAGLAIAIGLAVDNATAAISAITTPATGDLISLQFNGTNLTLSSSNGPYSLQIGVSDPSDFYGGSFNGNQYSSSGFTWAQDILTPVNFGAVISSSLSYGYGFTGNINNFPNNNYYGFAYGTGSGASIQYHYGWVNLTAGIGPNGRILTLNSAAINTIPGESILAGQTAVTAVPEPSTFIPAAALVMGALLRRRRPRSRRSGRATA